MKKGILLSLCVALAAAGCGGAQIKKQQAQIQGLQSQIDELKAQAKDKDGQIAALTGEKADLESKVKQLTDNLKSTQDELEAAKKNIDDLSQASQASQGELGGKVKELTDKIKQLIKEKGALSAKLDETEKGKSALSAQGRRAAAELARLRKDSDDLAAQLGKLNVAQATSDKGRTDLLAKVHDEMGPVADSILKEIQGEQAKIEQDGANVVITLQDSLLFTANQAKLTDAGHAFLDRLGGSLHALPDRTIRVQGHTDNATIKWELFGGFTNHWDLSAAQATVVARYLHEHAGLDPTRLEAEGFGEFRPIEPNDTPEGQKGNQRIVLIIEPPKS